MWLERAERHERDLFLVDSKVGVLFVNFLQPLLYMLKFFYQVIPIPENYETLEALSE